MGLFDALMKRKTEPSVAQRMAQAYDAADHGDYEKALSIWTPLAHAGVARAANNIGACFSEGLGVPRDMKLAERWLTVAAEAGDPVGQRNLASLYFKGEGEGEGVAQDNARALALYRAAAEQGDGPAQDMLSWMLLESEDVTPDYLEARRFAEAAAAQGIASSMTRLGMIHHNALGVERDAVEAAKWWRRAAALGDADAQAMLGAAYHLGMGVERDAMTALVWLIRARDGGSALAPRFFDAARATLSADDIAEAERRASLPPETAEGSGA